MYEIARERHIMVRESANLGYGIDGIYLEEQGLPPIIGLNRSIMSNTPYARCVFAEELGHHFTSSGLYIKKFYCYADRMHVNKIEYKAMKWGAEYLLPNEKLLAALRGGICDPWQLAEHFCVTEAMVRFRLQLLQNETPLQILATQMASNRI